VVQEANTAAAAGTPVWFEHDGVSQATHAGFYARRREGLKRSVEEEAADVVQVGGREHCGGQELVKQALVREPEWPVGRVQTTLDDGSESFFGDDAGISVTGEVVTDPESIHAQKRIQGLPPASVLRLEVVWAGFAVVGVKLEDLAMAESPVVANGAPLEKEEQAVAGAARGVTDRGGPGHDKLQNNQARGQAARDGLGWAQDGVTASSCG
jgi:hypothetical protein